MKQESFITRRRLQKSVKRNSVKGKQRTEAEQIAYKKAERINSVFTRKQENRKIANQTRGILVHQEFAGHFFGSFSNLEHYFTFPALLSTSLKCTSFGP